MNVAKPSYKRFYGLAVALCAAFVFFALLAWVGWKIAGSNLGIIGAKPGLSVVGQLADTKMRNMQQGCTGVVKTSNDVWLVGRTESSPSADELAYVPEDAVNLGNSGTPRSSRSMFGGSRYLTTLSRLQEDGSFKVEATVPDIACLFVTPQSEALYLFTYLPRPEAPVTLQADGTELQQRMVFRSTDRGESWEWLQAGFMSEASWLGIGLRPVFASDHEVWLWGDDSNRHVPPSARPSPTANTQGLLPTSLFYSSDGGQSASRLYSPEPLEPSDELWTSLLENPGQGTVQRSSTDTKRFVTQVSDQRAFAWVGQSAWHHQEDDTSTPLSFTTRVDMTRPDPQAPWQITQVVRQPHASLRHVRTSNDGQTHAVLGNEQGEWLVRLDTQTGEWVGHRAIPTVLPGWLVNQRMSARYFWSNGPYQVISLWGDIEVPRLLFPFSEEPASFTTDAHFYTDNGGTSWQQLAIPDYLGVMGLAEKGSDLFWTKGNWFENDEPYVWRYDLAQ